MEDSNSTNKVRKKTAEVTTFQVQFSLEEIKENLTINTNTPSNPSKEQIINQANKFHSEGNIQEAVKYYRYFINQGFKDHRVFTNYGSILQNLGKSKQAENLYRKAIELNPDYAMAHSNLGGILRDLGNLQDAELSTRKAIELNPDLADAYSNLGNILKDLGNLQDAELSTRKAIELNPNFVVAHYNLGSILIDLGNLQDAELSTRKAIELNPDFTFAHYNLGSILKDLGNLQDAELSTRKAIELNPNLAAAHSNLGSILIDLGNLQDAELSTRKAIELNPDLAVAHLNLGIILKDLGNLQEGQKEERRGIDLNFIQNIDSEYKENCLRNLSLSKSQFRQDLFALSELNFKKNGFFVEFGSCDGLVGSNSYLLEKVFNWDGILAEPAIFWHTNLKENRSVNIETKCVWKSSGNEVLFNEPVSYKQMASINMFSDKNKKYFQEGSRYKVQTISLLDLLETYQAPKIIDYLSIDTEGSEYEILKAFDFNKYKFRVITCEHNFTSMREKIYDLLISKGYQRKLIHISRVDDWYVLAE